jgi:hypothetical protein
MTVLRPGRLTDEPGAGTVTVGRGLPFGQVAREDVAQVMLGLLDAPRPGDVVEVVAGPTPIPEAMAALTPVVNRGGRG